MKTSMTEPHDEVPPLSGEGEQTQLIDLALVVWQHVRLLVFLPLLLGLGALGASFLVKPVFTAHAVFLPPQQQQSSAVAALQQLGALAGLAGAGSNIKNPADQYVGLMQSARVGQALMDRYKLASVYDVDSNETALSILADRTHIGVGKKDGLITVEVDDHDPQRAADLANAYIEELSKLSATLALTEAQQRRAFFEGQMRASKKRLTEAQTKLQQTGFNDGTMRTELKSAAEAYASIRAQVTAADVRLGALRGQMTPMAPEYKLAQAEASALRRELQKLEGADPQAPQDAYVAQYREFKYQETLFELFARQFEMAKLDEAQEGFLIQVVDAAKPPEFKSKPRKGMIAVLVTLGSGLLTLMFILVRHAWREQMRSPVAQAKLARWREART